MLCYGDVPPSGREEVRGAAVGRFQVQFEGCAWDVAKSSSRRFWPGWIRSDHGAEFFPGYSSLGLAGGCRQEIPFDSPDREADGADRLLAAELAGNFVVINDELVAALLSIVESDGESETLRGRAAIALGPALEHADSGSLDEDDVVISEATLTTTQARLAKLYQDTGVPKEVRRRVLEASVRAPRDWHLAAVNAAYTSGDKSWRVTAIFCMRYVRGFDDEIVESLDSADPDELYQAVEASGNWAVDSAWSRVAALVASRTTDKPLLLAAIDAVGAIRPDEAAATLGHLTDSADEDIVEATHEVLAMTGEDFGEEDDFDDELEPRN